MRFLFSLLLALATTPVVAGGLDDFLAFNQSTKTARAKFEQQVLDRSGKAVEKAQGTFAFARPGRFRWVYDKPHQQVLVADGRRLWIHDPDLNQVTIKRIDQAISATPAALLAGKDDITAHFTLSDGETQDGVAWVEARPRSADTGFERVRLGLKGGTLVAMELFDQLGGRTRLAFTDLERNATIPPGTFAFTPPKGADVIEDAPARR